jgi:hypothetical protein
MMQQLRALTERVDATAARVVDAAATLFGFATTGMFTNEWNAMPSVHATAICTHGKRYVWRLREMPT